MKSCPETYAIVRAMIERGNRPGLIREWLSVVRHWAETHGGQDAAALRNWLSIVQPKPFYTAHELALMWPGLKIATGLETRMTLAPSPERLANELKFCGLPMLTAGRAFKSRFGAASQYFIVEHIPYWRTRLPNQEEFERVLYGN